jgi:hypothetical protein
MGAVAAPSTPGEFARFLAAETARWGRLIKPQMLEAK